MLISSSIVSDRQPTFFLFLPFVEIFVVNLAKFDQVNFLSKIWIKSSAIF